MADRYQDRAYGSAHSRGGNQAGSDRAETDPLAELARLIGQTDPLGNMGRPAAQPVQRHVPSREQGVREDYYTDEADAQPAWPQPAEPASPPSWIQRANIRQEMPRPAVRELESSHGAPLSAAADATDYRSAARPLPRQAPSMIETDSEPPVSSRPRGYPQQDYDDHPDPPAATDPEHDADASRYDDALYGQLETGLQEFQGDPAFPDDPYSYQGEYDEELEEPPKRRVLPLKVAAVFALAVFGLAGAYSYHTYFGTTRPGEIPIIKADNSPTKIIPQPSEVSTKLPDRMVTGDGPEKIVPREEQPVDINSRGLGPRVISPSYNQTANSASIASVATNSIPAVPAVNPQSANPGSSGTLFNSEPRKVRTLPIKGDQPDASAVPVGPQTAPAAAAKLAKPPKATPSNANASANTPIALTPQGQPAETATQVATAAPTSIPSGGGGSYLVSIASQPTEADAQASFRSMQTKYPAVLGSQSPVIARGNTKSGAVTYRAGVAFATQAEATQFCRSYESAGGQCWVVKN